MNIRKKISNQAKRKTKFVLAPFKANLKSKYTKKVSKYTHMYKKHDVLSNHILYQSRDGKSISDSPYAIFLHLTQNKEYKDFKHIWVASNQEQKKEFEKMLKKYKNVSVIIKESDDYLQALSSAKYLINNSTFPSYFSKKPSQVYINTWHGTPLKFMGLDVEDNLVGSQNVIKNFLSSDYIISPNAHTTDIFNRAFKLENIYNGKFLEIGYPRIDLTINANQKQVVKSLKKKGLKINKSKTLLYAPTWRGKDVNNSLDNIEMIFETVKVIEKNTDFQILLKVHPFDYARAVKDNRLESYLVPDNFDTNELLAITDLLVTDYSSIFFDFLVTDNPIIFYSPDFDEYSNERGFYIELEKLPGPSAHDADALCNEINNIDSQFALYKDKYDIFKELYTPHDNGEVTSNFVDLVFHNRNVTKPNKNKETILMYPGGMKNNGITTSAINLLDNIDYHKYDVTILTNNTKNKEILSNLNKVNKNVRIILRKGPFLTDIVDYYKNTFVKNRGLYTFIEKSLYPREAFKREFYKIFGISKFDHVIDFSGYSMFWPNILLGTESKKKLIYLHSDIKSDMERKVKGRRPHYLNLKGVVTLYDYFDHIVSVSEETKKINVKNFSKPATISKFTSAMNTINLNKIYHLMNDTNDLFINNNKKVLVSSLNNEIQTIPFADEDYKIVSMGRLSPEKGFDILIDSFKEVVEQRPSAKLYILGEGPLRAALTKQINNLNLEDNVFLVGQKSNPFNIMKNCDLFVLTSHYEGQSMVLLEALTLNLSVLASNIPANRYVLNNGEYGMLVDNDIENVSEGILKFIDQQTPEYQKFDPHVHNDTAMKEFYSLLKTY